MYGFLKSQGEKYQDAVGNGWKIIGFDNEDHLQVGAFNDTSSLRDAVEFHPALIINGENLVRRHRPERAAAAHGHRSGEGRHGYHDGR